MTGETRDERTSKEVASIAPKLSNNPYSQVKVKSAPVPVITQRLEVLYSRKILSDELLANIDKKWEACWPINMLRPLVLLDLISYLLFTKELEEKQLIYGTRTETPANFTYAKEKNELSWSNFKEMDTQAMHELFTKEKGICDLVRNYGYTNHRYSLFVKEPLLLTPTAGMLANMVDVIKIMEAEDNDTRAAIFAYLLNKAEIVGQNGQVYAPDYVVKLVVALMRPAPDDVIGDPSAGNGAFLVNSAMYIANKNSAAIPNYKSHTTTGIYRGIESDLIQLRIGAMNMILHGIEDPKLESLNVLSKTNLSIREQPALILSNLFFEGTEDRIPAGTNTSKTETRRQEIRFLNFILKSLKSGGRAAVIIREIILYDNITEIKTIRQHIIDDHKLEAVISLPNKTGSLFSGACILIFAKSETNTTEKVWFYKMEAGKREIDKKDPDSINSGNNDTPSLEEHDQVTDILTRWKNEKEETGRTRADKSFYVPVDEIRTNNYNLSFNEYRKIAKESEQYTFNKSFIPDTESASAIIKQKQTVLNVKKVKLFKKIFSFKRKPSTIFIILMAICIGLAFYFIYFNKNNVIPAANNNDTSVVKNTISAGEINPEKTAHKPVNKTPATTRLSPEQIKAIIKDTTGIIHFQKQGDLSPQVKDPGKVLAKNSDANNVPGKKPEAVTGGHALKIKYTVVDTTFFHDQPDESTRRKSFLDPLNNNILDPIKDQNGFIFIIYTNRFGRTSKGWINKKDLKPVR